MMMVGGHGGGTARRAGSERLGHALSGEDLADGEHGSQASDEGATVHATYLLDLLRLARGAANRPTAIATASPIHRMGTSVGIAGGSLADLNWWSRWLSTAIR